MYRGVVGCGIGVGKKVVSLIDSVTCRSKDVSERERKRATNHARAGPSSKLDVSTASGRHASSFVCQTPVCPSVLSHTLL